MRHEPMVTGDPILLPARYLTDSGPAGIIRLQAPAARSSSAFLRFSSPTKSPNILL